CGSQGAMVDSLWSVQYWYYVVLIRRREMLASILIISISFVLLIYWFRYSCILLLRGYAEQPAAAHADSRFSFGAIAERLGEEPPMDALHQALRRDYQLITYLLQHAP